jgi:NADH dehydrogenase
MTEEHRENAEAQTPPRPLLVTGATGFVGGHVLRALRANDLPVRAMVRPGHDLSELRELGADIVEGDIGNDDDVRKAMDGVDGVAQCVGILREKPKQGVTFKAIHVDANRRLAEAARDADVRRFVLVSALGTRDNAPTAYQNTKYEGEQAVLDILPDRAVVLRPSLMFGPGSGFIEQLADQIRKVPLFVPVPGQGRQRMQPLHVADLAICVRNALAGEVSPGVYSLGGPEVLELLQIITVLQNAMGSRKVRLHVLSSLMTIGVPLINAVMSNPPITNDEWKMLNEDNICPVDHKGKLLNDLPKLLTRRPRTLEETLEKQYGGGEDAATESDAESDANDNATDDAGSGGRDSSED